jgi:hypothetical protein
MRCSSTLRRAGQPDGRFERGGSADSISGLWLRAAPVAGSWYDRVAR